MKEIVDLGLPRDEALILDGADDTFACLIFNVPAELLARIQSVAGPDAFRCEKHQAMVLNYLLELGTAAKEDEIEAESMQPDLF